MSLWHCDAELWSMQNPYVNYHSRKNMCFQMLFHGPSLTIVSQWGNFGALLPPRGTTYTPLRGMFSHSLIASSSVVIHKFLRNSRSELRPAKFGPMHCQWDFLGDFLLPVRLSHTLSLRKDIAHHSSISRTIWCLFHGSVTNGAGGVANRSFGQKKKNN